MAFWLYSPGSTGKPKAVVHLQHDIPYTCVTYAEQVLGITEKDTTFSTTGLFHAYGFGNNLTFPYWVGARSEEHTSELQSRSDLVCRLLLEKKTTPNRI